MQRPAPSPGQDGQKPQPFRAVSHSNRMYATMVLKGASQLPRHCVSTDTIKTRSYIWELIEMMMTASDAPSHLHLKSVSKKQA